jgi:hypothetical protein
MILTVIKQLADKYDGCHQDSGPHLAFLFFSSKFNTMNHRKKEARSSKERFEYYLNVITEKEVFRKQMFTGRTLLWFSIALVVILICNYIL